MEKTVSKDGTGIAYRQVGDGVPVVLVSPATCTHEADLPLAGELAAGGCAAYVYDRRGRGESGDTAPYAVAREVEDLAAVIEAAGGAAGVYGISSGGALALEAAASGLPIVRVAVYEVPWARDPTVLAGASAYTVELGERLAAGDRGGAVELFLRRVGLPTEAIAGMRQAPFWAGLVALAPTLAHDDAVMGGGEVPAGRLARIAQPLWAGCGGASAEWFRDTGRAIAAAAQRGRYETLEGQDHRVDTAVLAPVLARFFTG
ncbi:alpha/beta fold hydrolase [Streptomyces sp. DSM 44917]|uniref:Alpha/beta fold hydrolase n=1 Tax=Streptomyces boetiae TaxID=3075541 RepID=A0ABU2L5X8_9ACTN|nr:alpha/beta fold hydrolase [Streptomyces sp. DSM 44917]MDT0306961.1 alpha/beta fold hydrolase [Streptomyces sp. DSM 44917]